MSTARALQSSRAFRCTISRLGRRTVGDSAAVFLTTSTSRLMRPPSIENLAALLSRFPMIWRHRVASVSIMAGVAGAMCRSSVSFPSRSFRVGCIMRIFQAGSMISRRKSACAKRTCAADRAGGGRLNHRHIR